MVLAYVLFIVAALWLAYVYVGYAVALRAIGLVRQRRCTPHEDFVPSVSVLISARNEERDIGWKIRETLAWNYPAEKLEILVASDASEDHTDEILASFETPRLKVVRLTPRGGKNRALNHLAQLATGDLLFFTDANSHIGAGALRRMARWFADEKVGCVTGWERAMQDGETAEVMVAGGDTYLSHESWVNTLESRLGSVLVCDGSIFCIRRALYSTLDPDLANDLELPVRIGSKEYCLVYEPTAVSLESATASFREEFNRRRRICGQGVLGMWWLRHYLRGLRAWQFCSRKLLRWLTCAPLAILLVASVMLARSPFFAVVLGAQVALYVLAAVGWAAAYSRRDMGRLVALPFYFMLLNIGAITGVLQAIGGRRFAVWQSPGLSRGNVASIGASATQEDPSTTRRNDLPRASCMFSVDVEDWFHILDIPSTPPIGQWATLPSRVEANFYKLLELFAELDVRVTCFFLGWVAQQYPHLVRAAFNRGHEIASHGYSHELIYRMDRRGFLEDITRAKAVLEDISGSKVAGFRAPGFSAVKEVPWFHEAIAECGYSYDSSIFPATRGHGGMKGARRDPHYISTEFGRLVEFPVTVADMLGKPLCFFGGGYLRLFPYRVVSSMTKRVLADDRPVVFYIHPREIDPGHPRLPMSTARRFKTYVNLATTELKVRRLLTDFKVIPMRNYPEAYFPDVISRGPASVRGSDAKAAPVRAGGSL